MIRSADQFLTAIKPYLHGDPDYAVQLVFSGMALTGGDFEAKYALTGNPIWSGAWKFSYAQHKGPHSAQEQVRLAYTYVKAVQAGIATLRPKRAIPADSVPSDYREQNAELIASNLALWPLAMQYPAAFEKAVSELSNLNVDVLDVGVAMGQTDLAKAHFANAKTFYATQIATGTLPGLLSKDKTPAKTATLENFVKGIPEAAESTIRTPFRAVGNAFGDLFLGIFSPGAMIALATLLVGGLVVFHFATRGK